MSALAGISTTYYTWIEQGRTFDVSIEVLEAIAGALQLSEIEASYLFTLAGKAAPRPPAALDSLVAWRAAMSEFILRFEQGPALALAPWLDVNEANPSAHETLGIDKGTNLLESVLCGRVVICRQAESLIGALVALLRRNRARDIDNEHFNAVIERLCACSAAFRELWDGHAVDNAPSFEVELERSEHGCVTFHGVIVADPISTRQFALFMNRSN